MKRTLYKKVNHLYNEVINYWIDSKSPFKDEAIEEVINDLYVLCIRFLECNSGFYRYVYRKIIQIQLATNREVDNFTLFNYYHDSYIFKQKEGLL